MTQEISTEEQQTFAEHVRAFYAALPPNERALLEQVFALASRSLEQSEQANQEVSGYGLMPGLSPGIAPFGGLLSEIGFPALDGASKDAAKMSVKLPPGPSGQH